MGKLLCARPWTASAYPQQSIVRTFAKKRRASQQQEAAGPPANEELIAEIMKRANSNSPENVMVRLIIEQDNDDEQDQAEEEKDKKKSKGKRQSVDIVTLSSAIQKAVELDMDLIGISLEQEVPVLKAARIASLMYQSRKKERKSQHKSAALPEKEFQFKVQIGENDLARRLKQMGTFLQKGHRCSVRARAARWMAGQDVTIVKTFLKKLEKSIVEDDATGAMAASGITIVCLSTDVNEEGTNGTSRFERKSSK